MHVTVHYLAQIKRAAGCGSEIIETLPGTLRDFLRTLADRHDSSFRAMLLDNSGEPRKSLLFFVGDEHAEPARQLQDGDAIMILAPMAGG
ncbi:MAG: MoaD/ThiS family protein [Gemmataceae bacterium]|nr:MoaD/ThiS family protein [Gemmataceae bacterium]